MLWIDIKYANQLSGRLAGFKLKKSQPFLANFRCHYCGDSASNKRKKRGYIYEKKGKLNYRCHNCGKSVSFWQALLDIDPNLHKEYSFDRLKENGGKSTQFETAVVAPVPSHWQSDIGKFGKRRHEKWEHIKKLKKVSSLPVDHYCKQYIMSRQIPPETHYRLFFIEKFYAWVNAFLPEKFDAKALEHDHARLVIPFLSADGRLFGFQGRSFKKDDELRYITIMLDENMPKIFGLDKVDASKDILVVEGPIDSLFLPNSIALAGGDSSELNRVAPNDKFIMLFDNEPRSIHTIKRMEKHIEAGRRIVIWPEAITQKDPNDMVLAGICREELSNIISKNTYQGLSAKVRLSEWRKV